jgi:hypothetical protein
MNKALLPVCNVMAGAVAVEKDRGQTLTPLFVCFRLSKAVLGDEEAIP